MFNRGIVICMVMSLICSGVLTSCSSPPEGSAEWYFDRAYELASKGRFEEAASEYTKVIDAAPAMAGAYINRAAAYASLEKYDQCIADSTKAISLDPELAFAYINRAFAYNAMDNILDTTLTKWGKEFEFTVKSGETLSHRKVSAAGACVGTEVEPGIQPLPHDLVVRLDICG